MEINFSYLRNCLKGMHVVRTPFETVELWAWKDSKRVMFNNKIYKHPSGYPIENFYRLRSLDGEEISIYGGRSFQRSRHGAAEIEIKRRHRSTIQIHNGEGQ